MNKSAHWLSQNGKIVALVVGDHYGKRKELTTWDVVNRYGPDKTASLRSSLRTVGCRLQSAALFAGIGM